MIDLYRYFSFVFTNLRYNNIISLRETIFHKKTALQKQNGLYIKFVLATRYYIIPGIPPPIGIAGSALLISVITHSVVRSIPDTEAAFSRATFLLVLLWKYPCQGFKP